MEFGRYLAPTAQQVLCIRISAGRLSTCSGTYCAWLALKCVCNRHTFTREKEKKVN